MGNQLIKSTIILSLSSILSKFLGFFFRWPLVMLMGDEGIGYYQMAYPLYMFFIGIVSGMPIAVSKFVSERMAYDDRESILVIIRESFKIMIILGIGTSVFIFSLAPFIIKFLRWDPKVYLSLIGVSIAPVSICLLGVLRGVFQGMENMIPTGISQIIEQVGRVLFGVSLAFLLFPMGIEYAAGGASFGAAFGGIFSSLFIVIVYFKFKGKFFKGIKVKKRRDGYLMKILKISLPISLGATVSSIMVLIDSILVPQMLLRGGFSYKEAAVLYGQLTGKVSVLINLPLTLSVSLGTSIIPSLSKLFILGDYERFRERVKTSFKLCAYISFPCFMGLYFLSSPIMNVVFPNHSDGFEILKYSSISIPFIIFSQVSTSILQSTNNYIKPVLNLLVGCIIKVVLTLVLTGNSRFNIYGAVLATLFSYMVTSYLNLRDVKIRLNVKINIINIVIVPLFTSLFMVILCLISFDYMYLVFNKVSLSLMISIIIGGAIYCLGTFLFERKEIENIIFKENR